MEAKHVRAMEELEQRLQVKFEEQLLRVEAWYKHALQKVEQRSLADVEQMRIQCSAMVDQLNVATSGRNEGKVDRVTHSDVIEVGEKEGHERGDPMTVAQMVKKCPWKRKVCFKYLSPPHVGTKRKKTGKWVRQLAVEEAKQVAACLKDEAAYVATVGSEPRVPYNLLCCGDITHVIHQVGGKR
ncbi:hypothetical protein H6P81_019208 [Aristolochia fimbriata]|uniref:Uncharacterized protein n=1 Tax=Aristolochia fimbriata TaxID=158543 RepID=A0AAV7DR24_ARIFI|nr:hypothetical protein H6P81_019208 [Aristolochia fimbriata]